MSQLCKEYGRWKLINHNIRYGAYMNAHLKDFPERDRLQLKRIHKITNPDHFIQVYFQNVDDVVKEYPKAWLSQNNSWYINDTSFRKEHVYGFSKPLEFGEIDSYHFVKLDDNCWYNRIFVEGDTLPDYHSLKMEWRQNTFEPDAMLLGVEIEVSAYKRHELIKYVKSLGPKYATIERDGSLSADTGAEVVFRPMTLKEIYSDEFQTRFTAIKNYCYRFRQEKTYGMHLNLSRSWFDNHKKTELHQLKFAHIMNEAQNLTEKIAGRTSNDYAVVSKSLLSQKSMLQRKSFVNFSNRNRVEIRIFRSSLRWKDFMSQVQYSLALVEYSREASIQALNEKEFRAWLQTRTEYPFLMSVLKE